MAEIVSVANPQIDLLPVGAKKPRFFRKMTVGHWQRMRYYTPFGD